MGAFSLEQVQTTLVTLKGGEDLETPQALVDPGRCLLAHNYFPAPLGGYTRIPGFERFDGQAPPSQATEGAERIAFTLGTDEIIADDTLTQGAVTATVESVTVTSGDWATNDAAGYIVVTDRDGGDFAAGAATSAPSSGAATLSGAQTDEVAARRAVITEVPGSGPVRGVHVYNDNVYAFRDEDASPATKCVMWVSTTSGWTEVDLGERVDFSAGSSAFTIGETLTQGAVTATVAHVYVGSGDWATSDAVGYLILYGRAGGDFAAGAATGSLVGAATLDDAQAAVTLEPGGKYEFVNYNFYADAEGWRMYGCNGVDNAFEFDGSYFIKIYTGMDALDTPQHITAHKNYLFLSFDGGSVQHSPLGEPTSNWPLAGGAGELGIGDDVTGIRSLPGGLLGVFCRDRIFLLSGNSPTDFALAPHATTSGARRYTLQQVTDTMYLDDQGVTALAASDTFGGFSQAALSAPVRAYITPRLTGATCSTIWKEEGLYIVFFTDSDLGKTYASVCGFVGTTILGFTRLELPIALNVAVNGEIANREHNFVGAEDGFVYELFSGTSFDGDPITAYLKLPFNHLGGPRVRKRFRKAVFDIKTDTEFDMLYAAEFDYSDRLIRKDGTYSATVEASGSAWNIGSWGSAVWSGKVVGQAETSLQGYANNMALVVYTSLDDVERYTIESLALHFSQNRIDR